MHGGQEQARRNADRLGHVVVADLLAGRPQAMVLAEEHHQPRGDLKERLVLVRAQRLERAEPFIRHPTPVVLSLLALGGDADAVLISGSETATNVHGCRCAPDGAVDAARTKSSMMPAGTGSGLKSRTVRRRFMTSKKLRARAATSGSDGFSYGSGISLGFMTGAARRPSTHSGAAPDR